MERETKAIAVGLAVVAVVIIFLFDPFLAVFGHGKAIGGKKTLGPLGGVGDSAK